MFIPDLSLFSYGILLPGFTGLAVGWLGGDQPFPRGAVPEGFLDRLGRLEQAKLAGHLMGSHACEVCEVETPAERLKEIEDFRQRRQQNLDRLQELKHAKRDGSPVDPDELKKTRTLALEFARDASDYVVQRVYGDGEFHVPDPSSGEIYVTPTMIVHYVRDHGYQPPAPFVNAVMSLPE